jgi:predicted DNA-binding transcriptional regulator AlpA
VPHLLTDYISRTELAAELGICERTLIRWTDLGQAPPVTKLGRRPMFRRVAVAEWLARREQVPT